MSLYKLKTNNLTGKPTTEFIDGKTELLKAIGEAIPKKAPASVIFTVELAKRYPSTQELEDVQELVVLPANMTELMDAVNEPEKDGKK